MLKVFYFVTVLLLLEVTAMAQTAALSGKIVDSADRKPLAYATVTVRQGEEIVNFKLSTADGSFKVPLLPVGKKLQATISFVGYRTVIKNIELGDKGLEMGTVAMTAGKELQEVIITAQRPPIVVKKDTVEFNADAFKTMPNALVEDLFKKLPGFKLGKDGKLTVNGKPVERLLVNSREFFGTDPAMVMKNLDAAIVDKVQVTSLADELKYGIKQINEQDKAVTINITLKPWARKGVLGKAAAGAGTRKTYDASLIGNVFRDTLQVNILGFANNRNRGAFNYEELSGLGGFQRSGGRGIMGTSAKATQINDISFGGLDEGINHERGGGINVNNVSKGGLQSNIQYFYGHKNNETGRLVTTVQNAGTGTINSLGKFASASTGDAQSAAFRLYYKAGSKKNIGISVNPKFNNSVTLANTSANTTVVNNKSGKQSTVVQQDNSTNRVNKFNNSTNVNYRGQHGITFSAGNTISYNDYLNNAQGSYNGAMLSDNASANYNALLHRQQQVFTTENTAQLYKNTPLWTYGLMLSDTYEHGKDAASSSNGISFTGGNTAGTFTRNYNNLMVMPVITRRYGKGHSIQVVPGATWYSSRAVLAGGQQAEASNVYFSPNVTWNPVNNFSLTYWRNTAAPGMADMNPLWNIYNPLAYSRGNINLKPTVTEQVGYDYTQYFTKAGFNVNNVMLYAIKHNDVLWARYVEDNGRVSTMPLNTRLSKMLTMRLFMAKDFKLAENWTAEINPAATLYVINTRVKINDKDAALRQAEKYAALSATLQYKNVAELNAGYEWKGSRLHYNSIFNDLRINNNTFSSSVKINIDSKFIIKSGLNIDSYNQQDGVTRQVRHYWDAGMDYIFLPGNKAMLSITAHDILNQAKGITTDLQPGLSVITKTNVLPRYFFVSLSYNLKGFAKPRKRSAQWDLF